MFVFLDKRCLLFAVAFSFLFEAIAFVCCVVSSPPPLLFFEKAIF